MSVQAMGWVLDHSEAKAGDRLVLLALANHAGKDDWTCWPSVATIARESRMGERGTQYALRRLQSERRIEASGSDRSGTTIYRILTSSPADQGVQDVHPEDRAPVQPATSGGANDDGQGVHLSAPEPSREPSGEPGGSRAPAREARSTWPSGEPAGEIIEPMGLGTSPAPQERRPLREIPAAGVDPERWAQAMEVFDHAGFDDWAIEQHHGAIGQAIRELRLPPDLDVWQLGRDMLEARRNPSTRSSDWPASMLKMVAGRRGGPPRTGATSRGGSRRWDPFGEEAQAQIARLDALDAGEAR